ncbi:MAG: NifU family protein [Flavobacteriales bacterium]|jgi:Fe-S cluster biogenesis protein NfuA
MSEAHTTEAKVTEALEQLRPHLQFDGGDIRLLAVEGTTVHVELTGACSSCSISATTKAGVERAIKAAVPSVTEVFATTAARV